MSVSDFYNQRFGMNSVRHDIGCVISEIELVHLNIAKLLDLATDVIDGSDWDEEHIYAIVKGSLCLMVSTEPLLKALHDYHRETNRLLGEGVKAEFPADPIDTASPHWSEPGDGGATRSVGSALDRTVAFAASCRKAPQGRSAAQTGAGA